MASSSDASFTLRHQGRLLVNMASRCARVQFSGLQLDPGTRISITWMYCFNPKAVHPEWKEVQRSSAQTTVEIGGRAEFVIVFGSLILSSKPESVCSMILTRPDGPPPDAKSAPILPMLSYVLRVLSSTTTDDLDDDNASYNLMSGRVTLHVTWHELMFCEAVQVFEKHMHANVAEFLDVHTVARILKAAWDRMFMRTRHSAKYKQKREDEDIDDDTVDDVPVFIDTPRLSKEIVERIICIAAASSEVPSLISRRVFCGASTSEGMSIWRVFQALTELVGRSLFIRQLFNHRQLYLLNAEEAVKIHTEKFVERNESTVYFFRLPRTIIADGGLVAELFDVQVQDNGSVQLKPLRPTPYITFSQLERAKGNPYVAFTALESVHHEKLKALTPRGLIQPPELQLTMLTDDPHEPTPFPIYGHVNAVPRCDVLWWSSSDIYL